jgi:hypothetical protein
VSILQLLKMSVHRASTEHQQSVNRSSTQCQPSVNIVSTIFGVTSCIIQGLCYGIYPESTYWQPLCAQEITTLSQHKSEDVPQQSVNDLVCCILDNPRALLWHLPIIEELAVFIGNIVCIATATPHTKCQYSVYTPSSEC